MDLVPETLRYRVYLRGELGKLRRNGEATDFLASVDHGLLDRCGLPMELFARHEYCLRAIAQDPELLMEPA